MGSQDQRQAVAAGELVSARNLPPNEGNAVVAAGFLTALPHAALDATAVGRQDRARQEFRGCTLDRGYKRRSVQDLVDEIDLNLPAGDAPEVGHVSAVAQDTLRQSGAPHRSALIMHRSAIRRRKRSVSSTMDNLDNDGQNKDESTGVGLSGKREMKRSKYLLPPYTNDLDGLDIDVKEEDVGARDVMLLVRGFAKDNFHRRYFPKAADRFLGMLRSSMFASENTFANAAAVPECPTDDVSAKASADATIVVSDSSCYPEVKQGEGVFKRSERKNDQDGSGGSSIKGKEVAEMPPPKSLLGHGLRITPTIPIRQVRPGDVISQVKSGAGVDAVTSVLMQEKEANISAAIGLLPMHEGVSSQTIDGNEDTVQVQEPNASQQVMVLEVRNVPPSLSAPRHQLSVAEMRRGVKHMISRLQNGVKPVQDNLPGDLQRLLANLERALPGSSSSASASL